MAVTHWFAKDLVSGRHALGWASLSVGLISFAVFLAGQLLGWPSWRWAFFGLAEFAAALSLYARGRSNALVYLVGLIGVVVLVGSVIRAVATAL